MQFMRDLSKINYIYGSNGAGKTTISKLISNEDAYPACAIKWTNSRKLPAYVYNKDFVTNNFSGDEIKGVFTLGEDSKDIIINIESLTLQREKEQESLNTKKKNLDNSENKKKGILQQIEKIEENFKDSCWKQKKKHDDYFLKAFEGLRNSQENFKSRVIQEYMKNDSEIIPLEILTEKASTIYSDSLSHHDSIPTYNFDEILKITKDNIWQKIIIGKEDISVADLIKTLNNSDWVKEGLSYLDKSSEKCPFCQQKIPHDLKLELDEYFDTTYTQQKNNVESLSKNYTIEFESLKKHIDEIINKNSIFLDKTLFTTHSKLLLEVISNNINKSQQKISALSNVISMSDLDECIESFQKIILESNKKVDNNNYLYLNKNNEKESLNKQVWAYIVKKELNEDIKKYYAENERLNKTKEGLLKGIRKDEDRIKKLSSDIEQEEDKQTSVKPTINTINKILRSYGFKNFHLSPSPDSHSYRVIRENGDNALSTLSEGEKTFITFLYFYNLIKGSNSSSGVTDNRVVVFDDPISSLDSDILFIVSSLAKRLIKDIRESKSFIKQIFFLTHNIYFHKELTFDMDRQQDKARHFETFWVIRKKDNISYIENHECNPIKTSYDLLWSELKRPDKNCSTIQNTMRRILENYFKILGGVDVWRLEKYFDGEEKLVFNSLISWINDGSHYSNDDIYITLDNNAINNNMVIFQKIFEHSQNTAHYKMMMGEHYKELPKSDEIIDQGENEKSNSTVIELRDQEEAKPPSA